MPAIFTHVQFGKDVIASLPPSYSSLAEKYPQCFFAGTQGPDLLFYYKPWKGKKDQTRNLAWSLHDEAPEGFFLRAAKFLVEDKENYDEKGNFVPQSKEAAYLLGFLCHFCLDYTVHPYIEEKSVNGLSHARIESELDKRHFAKQNMPTRGFNAAKLFFPTKDSEVASANILAITPKETKKALKSMRFVNRLFSSKCGVTHGVCQALLSIAGMTTPFGDMFLHKSEDERCLPLWETLDCLYDEAIATACAVITEFFATAKDSVQNNILTNDIFRYNYGGILPQEENS